MATEYKTKTTLTARDLTSPVLKRMAAAADRANMAVGKLRGGLVFAAGTLGGAWAVATGVVSRMALETAGQVAALDDLSKATGVQTAAIENLRAAGAMQGADQEALDKGLKALALKMDNLRDKSDGVYKSLAAINPELAKQVAGAKDTGDALEYITGAMLDMTEEQKLATAEIIFGRQAADDYALALGMSRKEFAGLTAQMAKFKPVLTKQQVQALADLDDAAGQTALAWQGTKEAFAAGIAPGLKRALDALNGWLVANRGQVEAWGKSMGEWIAGIDWEKVASLVRSVGTAAETVANIISQMAGAFLSLTEAVGGADNAMKAALATYAGFKLLGAGKALGGGLAAGLSTPLALMGGGIAALYAAFGKNDPAKFKSFDPSSSMTGTGFENLPDYQAPAQRHDPYAKFGRYDGQTRSIREANEAGRMGRDVIDSGAIGNAVGAAIGDKIKGALDITIKVVGEGVSVAGTGVTKGAAVIGNVGATSIAARSGGAF